MAITSISVTFICSQLLNNPTFELQASTFIANNGKKTNQFDDLDDEDESKMISAISLTTRYNLKLQEQTTCIIFETIADVMDESYHPNRNFSNFIQLLSFNSTLT